MFLPKKRFSFSVKCSLTTRISRMLGLGRKCFVCKNLGWFAIAGGLSRPKLLFSSPDGSTLSSSGLYTRFLTANQSTQSMVFKNIQILSKSFWWIGECCAENSNIFISTSTPRVGTGQLLSQPGSLVRIAYWQANADGWTEFESVSGGCGWAGLGCLSPWHRGQQSTATSPS